MQQLMYFYFMDGDLTGGVRGLTRSPVGFAHLGESTAFTCMITGRRNVHIKKQQQAQENTHWPSLVTVVGAMPRWLLEGRYFKTAVPRTSLPYSPLSGAVVMLPLLTCATFKTHGPQEPSA